MIGGICVYVQLCSALFSIYTYVILILFILSLNSSFVPKTKCPLKAYKNTIGPMLLCNVTVVL